MLTKQQRFSFKQGTPQKSVQNSLFVLRYDRNTNFYYAIVVSKKIAASSVERNRIKRLYKSALTDIVKRYGVNGSFVFYVRKRSAAIQKAELVQHIEQIFKKEGIISQ